jgi:DNA processing protein
VPAERLLACGSAAELVARHPVPGAAASQVAPIHRCLLDWRHQAGAGLLTAFDPAYPALLRQIARPPLALFTRGDVGVLSAPVVAMVGARAATSGAREWTRTVAGDLARCGVLVASGMARGIDAAAHEGALAAGGATVAVLGCGLDRVYPPEHLSLARRIAARGCVLSEFLPGTPPRAWQFPLRNRILSGLAAGVVVVQAEPRSGALITAAQALDENRQVMAVPGDVHDPRSRGPHELLRQGAALVDGVGDIFAALGWSGTGPAPASGPAAGCAKPVPAGDPARLLQALDQVLDAEALRLRLGWEVARLQCVLAQLEVAGLVERLAGGALRRAG